MLQCAAHFFFFFCCATWRSCHICVSCLVLSYHLFKTLETFIIDAGPLKYETKNGRNAVLKTPAFMINIHKLADIIASFSSVLVVSI